MEVIEFEAGVICGVCLTLVCLAFFVMLFGEREEQDDEWNPWGGNRHGR